MRIAVVTERLPVFPWMPEHLGLLICRALAARGHDLHAVCEGVDDEAGPEPFAVHPRRGHCHRSSVRAWALRDHARRTIERLKPDTVLSLTRLVSAPVWMPLIPSAGTVVPRLWRTRGMEPWVREARALPLTLMKAIIEMFAFGDRYGVRRLLAFGPRAAESARTERPMLGSRIADAGFVSAVAPPGGAERAGLRRRIREGLEISDGRPALLVSSPSGMHKDLRPLLEAAAHGHRQQGGRAAILLIAAQDAYAVHDAALKLGAGAVVRIAGVTHDPAALYSAADGVAAWMPGPPDQFAAGSASRLIADALAFDLPVLALRSAPGAEMIADVRRSAAPGDTAPAGPGTLVDRGAALDWYIALQAFTEPAWRARASAAAAASAGRGAWSTLSRLADRLELELVGSAQHVPTRTAPASNPPPVGERGSTPASVHSATTAAAPEPTA